MPFMKISATAFAKYLARIPTNTSDFFSNIYPALEQSIAEQNPNVLSTCLAAFELKMETETFYLCLKATRDYLNSRDCQYVGKYQSKSFFFGGIKLVSPTPFLQSLNEMIDDFIATQSSPEPIHTTQSTRSSSIWDSGYQLLKSSVEILTSRPAILLTAILSYRMQMVYAANTVSTNGVELAECLATLPTTSFLQQVPQFMPYEYTIQDIPSFYRIHQNTNTPLDKVKIFLFGEIHNNDTHHSLKRYFISVLGKPGDYVLFEGYSSKMTFPCKQRKFDTKFICKGWEEINLFTQVRQEIFPNLAIRDASLKDVTSIMPDINNLHGSIETLDRSIKNLKKTADALEASLHGQLAHSKLLIETREQITKFEAVREKCGLTLTKIIENQKAKLARGATASATASSTMSGKKIVKERNKEGIIASLNDLKDTKASIFVLGGIAHFAPPRAHNGDDLSVLDKSDDQYELRDAISKKPSAILYPR